MGQVLAAESKLQVRRNMPSSSSGEKCGSVWIWDAHPARFLAFAGINLKVLLLS